MLYEVITIDGFADIPSGTTIPIQANTDVQIGEIGAPGYTRTTGTNGFVSPSDAQCNSTVNLPVDTDITCYIENTFDDEGNDPTVTLVKVVNGGQLTVDDFGLFIDGFADILV